MNDKLILDKETEYLSRKNKSWMNKRFNQSRKNLANNNINLTLNLISTIKLIIKEIL